MLWIRVNGLNLAGYQHLHPPAFFVMQQTAGAAISEVGFYNFTSQIEENMIIHYVLSINMSIKLIISNDPRYKIEPRYKIKV